MAGGLDRTRRDSYPSRYGTTEAERKSNVQLDAKLRAHLLGCSSTMTFAGAWAVDF
jgi:hypothetical protein